MRAWNISPSHTPACDLEPLDVPDESTTGTDTGRVPPRLLHVPAVAADILSIPESWLRRKAARREIPCTFVGKHLRFSDDDLRAIAQSGTRAARTSRRSTPRC
jgi:excisionase family DNA binding protein